MARSLLYSNEKILSKKIKLVHARIYLFLWIIENSNEIATPNFDGINPIQCVNGKLRKLHRIINSLYMERFKPFGLRGSMVSILFIIGKRKGINQKSIADMLILDQSTMSRDLKKLIKNNWVETFKGEDPRNSLLKLTKEGCLLLEEISPIWEELHLKVESILGSFQIQQIDNITEALKSNLKQLNK